MVLTDINVKVSFKVFIYVLQKVTADWPIGLLMVCKHIPRNYPRFLFNTFVSTPRHQLNKLDNNEDSTFCLDISSSSI